MIVNFPRIRKKISALMTYPRKHKTAVLSKLFALIKFIVTYDCDVNSHLFFLFFYFFGIFAEIRQTFRRSVFSARWLFGKMAFRRSGFRQSVVHRKNLCCGCSLESLTEAILMGTQNIGFYEEISKIIT